MELAGSQRPRVDHRRAWPTRGAATCFLIRTIAADHAASCTCSRHFTSASKTSPNVSAYKVNN
jgi:hypothetical protein